MMTNPCDCQTVSDDYSDHGQSCPVYVVGKAARQARKPPMTTVEELRYVAAMDSCAWDYAQKLMRASANEIERLQAIDRDFHNVDDVVQIRQLRGNLSLAEEGLASAMQQIAGLTSQLDSETRQHLEDEAKSQSLVISIKDEVDRLRLERHQLNNELTAARLDGNAQRGEAQRMRSIVIGCPVCAELADNIAYADEPGAQRCGFIGMYGVQCGLDSDHTGVHRVFGPHHNSPDPFELATEVLVGSAEDTNALKSGERP